MVLSSYKSKIDSCNIFFLQEEYVQKFDRGMRIVKILSFLMRIVKILSFM